jgi:hypothetical protein
MDEFLATLAHFEFIRNGAEPAEPAAPSPIHWQRLGQALFSPLAWACYVALIAAAVMVCIGDPRLAPHRDHVFFTDYLVVVELTLFVGQLPLTLLHELFHVLAGRRLGLRSSVRLGQRLHFLVFETVLDGLVAVPRRQRYLPMLAGMLADVLVTAGLTVTVAAARQPDGSLPLLAKVCLALAFTTLLRIVWQFYFYLRTDVYYLITTVLGCVDLQTTTQQLLRNRINAMLGRTERLVDETRWHPRDRRIARWYAPLAVAGYAVSIGTLAVVFIPLTFRFFGNAIHRVFFAGAASRGEFWDSAALLTLNVLQFAVAGWLALRERRRRAARAFPTPHAEPRTAEYRRTKKEIEMTTAIDPERHLWVKAPNRPRREELISGMLLPPTLASVDAHRRLRGPYTAAGALMRALIPRGAAPVARSSCPP